MSRPLSPMSEDLLYTNKFITPESVDSSLDVAKQLKLRNDFKKMYEAKFGKPIYRDPNQTTAPEVSLHQATNRHVKSATTASPDEDAKHHLKKHKTQFDEADNMKPGRQVAGSTLRSKIVCIDSRDRDISLFPNPAQFRVFLGEKFTNVRKIRLVSTELPNTEQLIKSQPPSKKNNKLYWQNGPQEADSTEIYSITITDGNYTAGSFANEVKTKTAAVERKITTVTGDKIFHDFDVVVDNVTNRFILRQNNSSNLDNPISTVAGSNIVTIQQDQHDFLPGQIVNVSGCTKVGGIPSAALNASQVIDIDIEKVDDIYRVSNSTQKATFVIYGTTRSFLTGKVLTIKGSNVVHGIGTRFLEELTTGQTVNIGFDNYTVQNVISDTLFSVDTLLSETFSKQWIVHNILPGDTAGFEPVANDPTRTKVNVINTKLRNINYTSASAYNADQMYEAEKSDLSLKNYAQMQNILTISNSAQTYQLQVQFDSREPTYTSFSNFLVKSNIENFNVVSIDGTNNAFDVLLDNGTTQSFVLPNGLASTIGVKSTLNILMQGWEVSYDTSSQLYYLKPPLQPINTRVVLPTVNINDNYIPYSTFGLDFSVANSAASIVGFAPQQAFGTVLLANSEIQASTIVTFDPQYNSIYFLSSGRLLYTIAISRTSFNSITDLVDLTRSTLLSRNIPIGVVYKAGMSKVMFYPSLAGFKFQMVFKRPLQPVRTLADALGYDPDYIHDGNVIVSVIPVKNYLVDAQYTFPLADQISGVPCCISRQIRGFGIITNTSNLVSGSYDVFDVLDDLSLSSLTAVTGSSNKVIGQISGKAWTLLTSPQTFTPATGHVYFSPVTVSASYDPAAFKITGKDATLYKVALDGAGNFTFVTSNGTVLNSQNPLTLQLGRSIVFDLINLPSSVKFKLSHTQNGDWNSGGEMLSMRRYAASGRFLTVTVPESYSDSNHLFYYDDSHSGQLTVTTNVTTVTLYYVSVTPQGYLQFAAPPTVPGGVLNYTITPVLSLNVGNKYIFDYSPLAAVAAMAGTAPDQLKLALTVDGLHYFGQELTAAPYLSYGIDPVTRLATSQIILDLSYDNAPFPERIFYYLRDTVGAGGAGYCSISYKPNAGVIKLVRPSVNRYDVFLSGPIFGVVSNDSGQVEDGFSLLYAPFNGLGQYTVSGNLTVLDNSTMDTVATFSDSFNVVLDNNRFVIHDLDSDTEATIAIAIGFRTFEDIAVELQTTINAAFGITDPSASWNVVYDAINNSFTFIVQNGKRYEFRFSGVDTNGIDLYNSAAELLGFSAADPRPGNTTAGATTTVSDYPCDISLVNRDIIKVPSSSLSHVRTDVPLRWSETAVHSADASKKAVFNRSPTLVTGTRFTKDVKENDTIILGEDYDQILIVTNVVDDYTLQVNLSVGFVQSTVADDGTIIPAPTTVYYKRIYQVDSAVANSFLTNEKLVFFRSPQAKSTYDYDGRLVDKNLQITRVSPIKLSLVDTDTLLELSIDDDGVYDYASIRNQDLSYIKNNSKYHFTTQFPSTSTIDSRGGNPIKVGTGVKYRLLFSNVDTPGVLLGFPNVGDVVNGNTDFKTVHSNTTVRTNSLFNVIRTEPGTAAQAGSLRVITDKKHNFEYGDTVYIEQHKNSSNDLAVNNDEGHTITLVNSDLTQTETENGILQTRGVFYISLSLKLGGIGGFVYKRKLYRPFALAGENYVYLTSPSLASLSTTSNRVSNVFAKLLLDAPPGAILFNSYVTSDKLYDESPLPVLEYLDISVVDMNGDLFEFNNINWSASFNIFYASQTPAISGISSRTMERSDV